MAARATGYCAQPSRGILQQAWSRYTSCWKLGSFGRSLFQGEPGQRTSVLAERRTEPARSGLCAVVGRRTESGFDTASTSYHRVRRGRRSRAGRRSSMNSRGACSASIFRRYTCVHELVDEEAPPAAARPAISRDARSPRAAIKAPKAPARDAPPRSSIQRFSWRPNRRFTTRPLGLSCTSLGR